MNVQEVLSQLDQLFRNGEYDKVEPFMLEKLSQAEAEQDKGAALTIMNELMGLYRSLSRSQESLVIASKAIGLMEEMGLKGSVPYGTTLLNAATAYRADGQTAKSIEMFEEVGRIFSAQKVNDAYLIATLYNNLSLAYQEINDHAKAIHCLEAALPLVKSLPNGANEVAVTYTNLALSKMKLQRLDDARTDLLAAIQLFESQPKRSGHYSAALAGLAEVAYKTGNPQDAIAYYERTLAEILARYGKNMNYAVTLESLAVVYEDIDKDKSMALEAEAKAIYTTLK